MRETPLRRITAFLQIRSGEGQLTLLVSALFFIITTGTAFSFLTVGVLFRRQVGAERLTYMYIALGLLNMIASTLFAGGISRFKLSRLFSILPVVFAGILVVERLLIPANRGSEIPQSWAEVSLIYPVLWLTVFVINTILITMAWNIAGEVTDTRQAKRLFSLFGSASILGTVVGNGIINLVNDIHTEIVPNLLLGQAVLLLAALVLIRMISRRYIDDLAHYRGRLPWIEELKIGGKAVMQSPILRLVALTAILTSVLFLAIDIPFEEILGSAIPNEVENAAFTGSFNSIVTVITLLISLLLASRLTKKIGVVSIGYALLLAYLIGFSLLLTGSSLTNAVIAKGLREVILNGLVIASSMIYFNLAQPEKRAQANSFINGAVMQIGLILSASIQLFGNQLRPNSSNTSIYLLGLIFVVITMVVTWWMQRGYRQALIDALQAGRYDVFSGEGDVFADFRAHRDASTMRVLVDSLESKISLNRKLAIDMIGRIGNVRTLPLLVKRLEDENPEVQISAIESLGRNRYLVPQTAITKLLQTENLDVYQAAIRHLPDLYPSPTPQIFDALEATLDNPKLELRTTSAMAFVRYGILEVGLKAMVDLVQQPGPTTKLKGLETIGEMALIYYKIKGKYITSLFDLEIITNCFKDEYAIVRLAACQAAGKIKDPILRPYLVDRLEDRDEGVRFNAAAALKTQSEHTFQDLLVVLEHGSSKAQEAVLIALPDGHPDIQPALSKFIIAESQRLKVWRQIKFTINIPGRVSAILREVLAKHERRSEIRLIHALDLFAVGDEDEMQVVREGLQSNDNEKRAAAIEALDILDSKDSELKKLILDILDDTSIEAAFEKEETAFNPMGAIQTLINVDNEWIITLAIATAGELKLTSMCSQIEAHLDSPYPLVAETAAHVFRLLSGEEHKMPDTTLRTISSMERILLLRDVPLFEDLSVEDLKQIADLASEQLYYDGDQIVKQGAVGNELYIIANGEIEVRIEKDSQDHPVAVYTIGDFIGEMAVLESAPRSASAYSKGDARVLVIEGESFKAIIRDRPSVALAVLSGMSRRVREMNRLLGT
ncbi:Npt1/Npt2 family nucleotide transporter [Chloroflexota bacterium]